MASSSAGNLDLTDMALPTTTAARLFRFGCLTDMCRLLMTNSLGAADDEAAAADEEGTTMGGRGVAGHVKDGEAFRLLPSVLSIAAKE